jgi:hypothetical protein
MRIAENQVVFETLVKIRTLIQCNAVSKPSENRRILTVMKSIKIVQRRNLITVDEEV